MNTVDPRARPIATPTQADIPAEIPVGEIPQAIKAIDQSLDELERLLQVHEDKIGIVLRQDVEKNPFPTAELVKSLPFTLSVNLRRINERLVYLARRLNGLTERAET